MPTKRSIFEEVSGPRAAPARPAPGRPDGSGARRGVRLWLIALFALVVAMIAVGGLTRLTDSGLSITEWRPITGALPPLSAEAWEAEFEKYRQIPEYQLQNRGMSLAEFKVIYWWEWGHRQLGRVIGLVWAAGLLGFVALRKVPRGWTPRLLGLGLLGGLQGAIGWWMVSSGLDGTALDVASYRLAVHLGLAFVILGLIAWYIFRLSRSEAELLQARRRREGGLALIGGGLVGLVYVQVLLGALVAGIDAGRSYAEWPLMGGQIVPPGAFDLAPVWRNFFENAGLVQFVHRVGGYAVLAAIAYAWFRSRRSAVARVRGAFHALLAVGVLQLVLGIWTVLAAAPWYLGLSHQALAVALFVLALRARFLAAYPPEQRIARA